MFFFFATRKLRRLLAFRAGSLMRAAEACIYKRLNYRARTLRNQSSFICLRIKSWGIMRRLFVCAKVRSPIKRWRRKQNSDTRCQPRLFQIQKEDDAAQVRLNRQLGPAGENIISQDYKNKTTNQKHLFWRIDWLKF